MRYYDDPPEGKLPRSEWEIRNENEIIDRFLEEDEELDQRIKEFLRKNKARKQFIALDILTLFAKFKGIQYEEYLDTEEGEEYDRMAEEERYEKMSGEE